MAYANVQSSGKLETSSGAGLSWTPGVAPTLNNLLTFRGHGWRSGGFVPGATDVKDSSGTPKNFARDVSATVGTAEGVTINSLLVPSGLTTPLKNTSTATILVGIFDEWSGNVTSTPLDTSNTKNTSTIPTGGSSTYTGATINTSADAGLVLACFSDDDAVTETAGTLTSTGSSFTQNCVEVNGSSFSYGSEVSRTATLAGQTGLGNTWSVQNTSALTLPAVDCIASYNALPSGPPPSYDPGVFGLDARRMI